MLKFNEHFVKNSDEDSYEGYILKIDVKYPKTCITCIVVCRSYQKEWKSINAIALYAICMIKTKLFT